VAKIKLGSLISEASGSLGGHTIQHSKGGMQLRTKPVPANNPTASQSLIRSLNHQLQKGWRDLTNAQRQVWNDWATSHDIQAERMPHNPISGHSLWMKYNFSWLQAGGSFLQGPWEWGGYILGPELIENGSFSDASAWYNLIDTIIAGGKANYGDNASGGIRQAAAGTNGLPFLYKFDISNAATAAWIKLNGTSALDLFAAPYSGVKALVNGHYEWPVVVNCVPSYFRYVFYTGGSSFSLDNVSLRQRF
jgi:hypothetical protein